MKLICYFRYFSFFKKIVSHGIQNDSLLYVKLSYHSKLYYLICYSIQIEISFLFRMLLFQNVRLVHHLVHCSHVSIIYVAFVINNCVANCVIFKLGNPPFKEHIVLSHSFIWHMSSILSFHICLNDMLNSNWVVRLSKWHVGLSHPFKCYIRFKIGLSVFPETCWVVTSFKVTYYLQIGSSAFKETR